LKEIYSFFLPGMSLNYNSWKKIFLVALGLFAGAAFCMKWMEGDFIQNGEKFTIIGLELTYPKEMVARILAGLDGSVKMILRYHLSFDFAFMAGVYPGITALCMMAKEKSDNKFLKKMLFVLAVLQIVAWGCDIYENVCLLNWIKDPAIGNNFGAYHFIVAVKWIIALTGALLAIPLALRRPKLL